MVIFTGDSSAETAIQKAIDEVNGRVASGEGLVKSTEEDNTNQSAKQSEKGDEEGSGEKEEQKEVAKGG